LRRHGKRHFEIGAAGQSVYYSAAPSKPKT
jgi:hypothetical protein